MDAAHRFFIYLCLHHIISTLHNDILFTMQKAWNEFERYVLQTSRLLVGILSFPSSVAIALGVIRPAPSIKLVIDIECVAPVVSIADVMVAAEGLPSSHVPYMITTVPLRKRYLSITIARSSKKFIWTLELKLGQSN